MNIEVSKVIERNNKEQVKVNVSIQKVSEKEKEIINIFLDDFYKKINRLLCARQQPVDIVAITCKNNQKDKNAYTFPTRKLTNA